MANNSGLPTVNTSSGRASSIRTTATEDAYGSLNSRAVIQAGDRFASDQNQRMQELRADTAAQLRDDKRAADTSYNRAVTEMSVLEDEFSLLQGDQAEKGRDAFIAKKNALREKYAANMSPDQQAMFGEDFDNASARSEARAMSHVAKQKKWLEEENDKGRLELNVAEAARSVDDPMKLAQLRQVQVTSLARMAANNGIPAGSDAEKAFVEKHMSAFHGAVASTLISSGNVSGAEQYAAAHEDEISGEVRASISKHASDAREADAPFALSDAYYDPTKSYAEQAAALRDYGMRNGVSTKTLRGALGDLGNRYSEQASAIKEREEQLIVQSSQMTTEEYKNFTQTKAYSELPDDSKARVDNKFLTTNAPIGEQENYKNRVLTDIQVNPERYRDFLANPTSEFNRLDNSRQEQIIKEVNRVNGIADGTVPKSEETALGRVRDRINADFLTSGKDATPATTRMNADIVAAMDMYGKDYVAAHGKHPTYAEASEFYEVAKTKVIRAGLSTTLGGLYSRGGGSGEAVLDQKSVETFRGTSTYLSLRDAVVARLQERNTPNPQGVADKVMKSDTALMNLAQLHRLQKGQDLSRFYSAVDAAATSAETAPLDGFERQEMIDDFDAATTAAGTTAQDYHLR